MGMAAKAHRLRHVAPKMTVDELVATSEQFHRATANFLKIDVATALTFAGIALETHDPERKARNKLSARHAYDTVLRLIDKVTLNHDDIAVLRRDLQRLKTELQTMGEEL